MKPIPRDPTLPIGIKGIIQRAGDNAAVVLMRPGTQGGAFVDTGSGDCATATLGAVVRDGAGDTAEHRVTGVICRGRDSRPKAVQCALARGGVAEIRLNAKPDKVIASSRTEKPTGFKPLTRATVLDAIGDVLGLGDDERVVDATYTVSSFADAARYHALKKREQKGAERARGGT